MTDGIWAWEKNTIGVVSQNKTNKNWCRDQDNSTGYSWNNILAKNKVVVWGTDDIRKKGKSLTFQSWKLLRLVPVPSISSFDFFFISAGSLEPEISKTIKCRLRRWILLNNSKTGYRSFFFSYPFFFLILVNLQQGILLLKFQKCYIFIFLFACNNDSCFKSSNSWLFVCQQLHAPWSFSPSLFYFVCSAKYLCLYKRSLFFSFFSFSLRALFFFSLLFHFSIDHSSYKLKNKLHIFQFSIHTLKEAFDSPLKLLKPEKY